MSEGQVGPRNDLPAVVERLLPFVRQEVIPAYDAIGALAFVYAQGSLVAGYTSTADLDLVLVWQAQPPRASFRPVSQLNDGARPYETYDVPGFVVDRFWASGQEYSLKHETVQDLDGWISTVHAGHGWHGSEYPRPLAAVSGFRYGILLHDPAGEGIRRLRQLDPFPSDLVRVSREALLAELPGYRAELRRCAQRGDGLLFHELLTKAEKTVLVAWFSARGIYMPHEKWLARSIQRHAPAPRFAELESELWSGGLDQSVAAFEALVAYVGQELGLSGETVPDGSVEDRA